MASFKLYAESKIKPTHINNLTIKKLTGKYPILKKINFFSTITTSSNDTIYVVDFKYVKLIEQKDSSSNDCYVYKMIVTKDNDKQELSDLILTEDRSCKDSNYPYYIYTIKDITLAHCKSNRFVTVLLDSKDFNKSIDKAIASSKSIVDRLEFRIKKLKKIDWKV